MDKRTFIKNISFLGATPAFGHLDKWIKKYEHIMPLELAADEVLSVT